MLVQLLVALLACMIAPFTTAAVQQPMRVDVDGQPREYILAGPDIAPEGPRALVLLLHGHLGSAANALGAGRAPSPLTAWLRIADRERIWIAALQGLVGPDHHTGWHDCRGDDPRNPSADDVAFADSVVRLLIAQGRVDPARIYVMGMSNGAMMSHRLALEMTPAPVAIAAVSGTMARHSDCIRVARPVSVLLIQGTRDPLVPYDGGAVGFGGRLTSEVMGAEATRDFWLQADGLSDVFPVVDRLPHLGMDATRAERLVYGPDSGPQVELIRIVNGGHVEPSLQFHYGRLYERIVGAQNRDFESAEEAWRFFARKRAD